ncbi:hypothetical protein COP1_004173 [Malus domestica]
MDWEFSNRQNLGNLITRKVKLLFLDPDTLECLRLKRDYWKSKELSFISHAKEVVIHYKFRSNVIEFAYCILEHAHDLEKMIIYYPHRSEVLNAMVKLRTTVMSKGIHFHKIVTHYDHQELHCDSQSNNREEKCCLITEGASKNLERRGKHHRLTNRAPETCRERCSICLSLSYFLDHSQCDLVLLVCEL